VSFRRVRCCGRVVAAFALALLGSAWAAACNEADYSQVLELRGLGTVFVSSLRFEAARDRAELSGGLCFVSEADEVLTVTAPRMVVERLSTDPRVSVEAATLRFGEVTVFAEHLGSAEGGFALRGVAVSSPQASGSARSAHYTLADGRTALSEVTLRLGNFRVQSVEATLTGGALVLREPHATTCTCEEGGLYTLRAPSARVDFLSGVVQVRNGVLETLGLRIALDPNLRLLLDAPPQPGQPGLNVGGARLLPSPAAPEPVGETLDEGTKVSVPIQLLPDASLELGVAGLDEDRPLGLVSLLRLGRGNVRAAFGRAGPGLRADLLVRRPLAPGVGLDFSLTNRHWVEEGFLHEGALALYAGRRLTEVLTRLLPHAALAEDTLALSARAFAAFSSQQLPSGSVLSPRLGVQGSAVYTLPRLPVGTFALRTESTLTHYPSVRDELGDAAAQFSLRFVPSWRAVYGPLTTTLSFERQLVLGGSPFSARLDRLEPRSLVNWAAELALPPLRFGVQARYNLLAAAEGRNPVRRLHLSARRDLTWEGGRAGGRFEAELAGLLGPPEPNLGAFVRFVGDVAWEGSGLELGTQVRYNLLAQAAPALELLELSASYPVTLSDVTLRPFLALNAAPLLTGASLEAPEDAVSGYGLELAVRSCCGTLMTSYRLHNGAVRTAFDVQLVPAPEVQP
jgi:hypothetical protein